MAINWLTVSSIYFVGIKGTGVSALAELMLNAGMKVSGSDTPDTFYTDVILKSLNILFFENFDAAHINSSIDLLIHSAAYSADTNPEINAALQLKIPVLKYTDALGEWSKNFDSTGICGVHGKTTTTAITGVLMRSLNIPAQILAGAAVAGFDGKSTLSLGNKYFIAETCEYKRHFLSFHPKRIILTSVECDHQDYFPDYKSILNAFVEYCLLLPSNGELIYCADDPGAAEAAKIAEKENRGITLIPYGFSASGDYKIISYNVIDEKAVFRLQGFPGEFTMKIPGRHQALNAAAAIALTVLFVKNEYGCSLVNEKIQSIKTALENFSGSKRRSEILGEAGGIIFMDDYGHHPTAIKTTLAGIKSFYPARRLVCSFMPHTYTRTSALLEEFAGCFTDVDLLFLHKIYASARENYTGGITGKTLYEKTINAAAIIDKKNIFYIDEPEDSFNPLVKILKPGDIFLTLGAGNNWQLGEKLFSYFQD